MSCSDRLKYYKEQVDRKLDELLPAENTELSRAMRYAVLSGGKRFRPLLTLATVESLNAELKSALPFACGLEFIHNYSLVHDDLPLMDDDDFRRGKPTCHKVYGEDIALLVGDALLTAAFDVLAHAPLLPEYEAERGKIIGEVSRQAGYSGMIGGQFLDVTLSSDKISEDEFHVLIQKKTGALILAAVRIGALLGNASPRQLEALTEYGKNIGLAFQTRDDINDRVEDAAKQSPARSNSVSLFGPKLAEKMLRDYVDRAITALDRIVLESDELRCLAYKLLQVKKG